MAAGAELDFFLNAENGGFLGLGCNDDKLIAALCTRTKSQLTRTRQRYRAMYDKDLRAEVKGEADSRSYGRMMFFAMAAPDEYVAACASDGL